MKTLVFSFDGTGNEPSQANEFKQDESITNVLKLHVMMGGCMEAGKSAMETASGATARRRTTTTASARARAASPFRWSVGFEAGSTWRWRRRSATPGAS